MKILYRIIKFFKFEAKEYGVDQIIRKYSGFPGFLTLPCHCEHGWTALDVPLNSDLVVNKLIILVFSQRRKKIWKKHNKIVLVFGAPLVRYRKMHELKIKENASGTIAFPAHSSEHVCSVFDENLYCNMLNELPSKYQPVTVCLHWHDILKGREKIFVDKGFNVVTAGDMYSSEFPKNFYDILTSYKYSTSNEVGSYSFYSVEIGIPFFLSGPAARMFNNGVDLNVPQNYFVRDFPSYVKAYKIFDKQPVDIISREQRDYVDSEIGGSESVSRNLLFLVLILMYPIDRVNYVLIFIFKILRKIATVNKKGKRI